MPITVRPENADPWRDVHASRVSHDAAAIREIHEKSFGRPNEADLIDEIRQSPRFMRTLSLVAERDGRPVGHVLFSPIWVEQEGQRTSTLLSLAPVAVLEEARGQGVAARLIWTALIYAAWEGFRGVLVLGSPAYYGRFGFVPASQYNITGPFDAPDDHFMALPLTPGGLDGVTGKAVYPPAFNRV